MANDSHSGSCYCDKECASNQEARTQLPSSYRASSKCFGGARTEAGRGEALQRAATRRTPLHFRRYTSDAIISSSKTTTTATLVAGKSSNTSAAANECKLFSKTTSKQHPCAKRRLEETFKLSDLPPARSRYRQITLSSIVLIAVICLSLTSQSVQSSSATGDTLTSTSENHRTTRDTDFLTRLFSKWTPETTTTTSAPETSTLINDEDEFASARDDDDDAEGCTGLSAHEPAEGKNISEVERLVKLQSCIRRQVKKRLASATRSGMEIFERLSLSGGCTASLLNLMVNLGDIKSFAFKFLDASAKLPSGIMYGLLSDFGDFDQCISIRSNPGVPFELEAEERAYSGKYCLMNVRLNYHIKLAPNTTVPEGIQEDGVLWDELLRNYWTSKSTKGFQVGMCLPSRCTTDDIDQLYKLVAESYNIKGEVISCQDGLDLQRQHAPDFIQKLILCIIYALILLTALGTFIHRYYPHWASEVDLTPGSDGSCSTVICQLLICFSLSRNWRLFTQASDIHHNSRTTSQWDCLTGATTSTVTTPKNRDHAIKINREPGFMRPDFLPVLPERMMNEKLSQLQVKIQAASDSLHESKHNSSLSHLSGLRLLVIFWITIGHSFLYPSANNYQHYRSIINMNITRDSVWFATTNFTLGIDTLLYMTGLVFVYKLAHLRQTDPRNSVASTKSTGSVETPKTHILWLISKKILRFWPTYLAVIAFAIVAPLISDGPMWPEMVSRRIGATCRQNWWANLLFINNYLSESQICLPSSWFVSVIMQLFIIGSFIVLLEHRYSLTVALIGLSILLTISCGFSFAFAYIFNVRAPVIRMDETFVLEMDDDIWRLYINIFNNLGPFLVGMIGGYVLIRHKQEQSRLSPHTIKNDLKLSGWKTDTWRSILVALLVTSVGALVLSSVFHQNYTRFWASTYWSLHRVGWAVVTGYVIHNCATGRWQLLKDLLSLTTLLPLSRLIFIAYLLYPIFIYMHSGLVRDGLHVSIYNMTIIYTSRLVITFAAALFIHLLVELPFCSIEKEFNRWMTNLNVTAKTHADTRRNQPLLTVVPNRNTPTGNGEIEVRDCVRTDH